MTAVLVALLVCGCAGVTPLPRAQELPITLPAEEHRALVVVRVPSPWWAADFLITGRFIDTLPEYARAPGLEQKAYTLTDDHRFGGVYLWESRAAAEHWFDEAWHARVRKQRGVEGDVRILDARFTVGGPATPTGRSLAFHGLRTDAVVTWLSSAAGDSSKHLEALAHELPLAPGLIRVSFVTEPDGRAGAVGLWTSRDAARAYWTRERTEQAAKVLGAEVELIWFAAPVLLDAVAAKKDARAAGE
jgi:heme-degrading monooxygenase HmoA